MKTKQMGRAVVMLGLIFTWRFTSGALAQDTSEAYNRAIWQQQVAEQRTEYQRQVAEYRQRAEEARAEYELQLIEHRQLVEEDRAEYERRQALYEQQIADYQAQIETILNRIETETATNGKRGWPIVFAFCVFTGLAAFAGGLIGSRFRPGANAQRVIQ